MLCMAWKPQTNCSGDGGVLESLGANPAFVDPPAASISDNSWLGWLVAGVALIALGKSGKGTEK